MDKRTIWETFFNFYNIVENLLHFESMNSIHTEKINIYNTENSINLPEELPLSKVETRRKYALELSFDKLTHQATFEELKLKEHVEVLRKRIYIQRLPDRMDRTINRSVDQIEHSLSHPVLNNDGRATLISTCSKTVTQFKFDLMTINLETIQMTQRDQRELLVALQNELLETMPNETLQQIMANRRENMIQRYQIHLKHKLKTFFDEAPMAIEN